MQIWTPPLINSKKASILGNTNTKTNINTIIFTIVNTNTNKNKKHKYNQACAVFCKIETQIETQKQIKYNTCKQIWSSPPMNAKKAIIPRSSL